VNGDVLFILACSAVMGVIGAACLTVWYVRHRDGLEEEE